METGFIIMSVALLWTGIAALVHMAQHAPNPVAVHASTITTKCDFCDKSFGVDDKGKPKVFIVQCRRAKICESCLTDCQSAIDDVRGTTA